MSGLVYYALGGGHGHALRGLALTTRLGRGTLILPERLAAWASDLGVEHRAVADDRGAPAELLDALGAPELLLVDVFPRGVLKELGPLLKRAAASWLVTRHVKPGFYLHPPVREAIERRFERVVWSEAPPPELVGLAVPATRIAPVLLAPEPLPRAAARDALGLDGDDRRLVLGIGSGSPSAQRRNADLIAKLAERLGLAWRFVSRELPVEPGAVVPLFPLARHLAAADVAVAAGGYHAFHELRAAGVPAVFIPRPRRHDDQAHRVRDEPIARDPIELEREVERALDRAEGSIPRPVPADADAGARALVALVERRMQESVLGEEQVAALARS